MNISDLIVELEQIQKLAGDVNVATLEDICGSEHLAQLSYVSLDTDKQGVKLVVLEFKRN